MLTLKAMETSRWVGKNGLSMSIPPNGNEFPQNSNLMASFGCLATYVMMDTPHPSLPEGHCQSLIPWSVLAAWSLVAAPSGAATASDIIVINSYVMSLSSAAHRMQVYFLQALYARLIVKWRGVARRGATWRGVARRGATRQTSSSARSQPPSS